MKFQFSLFAVLEVIKKFSFVGSLHGYQYLFGRHNTQRRRGFRARQLWFAAILASIFIFCIYFVRTTKEHFFLRPTVTSLGYIRKTRINFPEIELCPSSFGHQKYLEDALGGTKCGELIYITLVLTFNPLYMDFRYRIDQNLTAAFEKYKLLRELWVRTIIDNDLVNCLRWTGILLLTAFNFGVHVSRA